MPRPGAARAQQRRVDPAVVDQQRRHEGDRIAREQRELRHQQDDARPAHQERAVRVAQDARELRVDVERLAGVGEQAGRDRIDAPRERPRVVDGEAIEVREDAPA